LRKALSCPRGSAPMYACERKCNDNARYPFSL
jgi:hypothetical protein